MRDVLAAQPAQTPQPVTQALTVQEIEQIIAQHDYEIHGDRAHYIVRLTEEIHGITANGGGNKV